MLLFHRWSNESKPSRMKKHEVRFDIDAEDDFFEIYRYVAMTDSIGQVDELFESLKRSCYSLRTSPLRGNIPPELQDVGVSQFREIRFKPYRIIYSIEQAIVTVHCILDGRRDMQTLLQERFMR